MFNNVLSLATFAFLAVKSFTRALRDDFHKEINHKVQGVHWRACCNVTTLFSATSASPAVEIAVKKTKPIQPRRSQRAQRNFVFNNVLSLATFASLAVRSF